MTGCREAQGTRQAPPHRPGGGLCRYPDPPAVLLCRWRRVSLFRSSTWPYSADNNVNGGDAIMANVTPVRSCWVSVMPNNGRIFVTLQIDDTGTPLPVTVGSISDATTLGDLVAARRCGYDNDSGRVVTYYKAAS